MASKTLATIFILSLLFFATFTSANKCAPVKPSPTPTPVTPKPASCPIDALKLGVCADVLGLVKVKLGEPPSGTPCCALLKGLVDLEAAACLCTVIKANVLGINLNVPVTLELLISACQKTLPPGFTCPK